MLEVQKLRYESTCKEFLEIGYRLQDLIEDVKFYGDRDNSKIIVINNLQDKMRTLLNEILIDNWMLGEAYAVRYIISKMSLENESSPIRDKNILMDIIREFRLMGYRVRIELETDGDEEKN